MEKINSIVLTGVLTGCLLAGCGSTYATDSYMGVAAPADDIAYDSTANSAPAAEPPMLEEKAFTDDFDTGAEPADELAVAEETAPVSGGMDATDYSPRT